MRLFIAFVVLLVISQDALSQSAKITAFALKVPVNRSISGNTAGFKSEQFQAGGSECPAVRLDIRFQYAPSTDRTVVLQTDGLSKDEEAVLMRISLVDIERDEVVASKIVGLPQIGPQERTVIFPTGERSGKYQLWFQDYWEVVVNGMTRPQTGTFVTWEGSTVTLYQAKAVASDEAPKPQPKRRFRVD